MEKELLQEERLSEGENPGEEGLLQEKNPGEEGLLQEEDPGEEGLLQEEDPGEEGLLQEENPGQEEEPRALSVEEAFEELDRLVARMEADDIPLEESFACYEKGIRLVRYCNARIDRVEKKVRILRGEGEPPAGMAFEEAGGEGFYAP